MRLLLALFVALFPVLPSHSSAGSLSRGIPEEQRSTITLTVQVLPTSYGVDTPPAETYPKTIQVSDGGPFSELIAAYGLANRVWIAPKGWIGSAAVAFDGRTVMNLYPPNGSAKSGPRFRYEDTGGCAGCALDGAAPYFPKAMEDLKKLFGTDTVETLPRDTKLVSVSSSLVMYSLPGRDGLLGSGAAYFLPPNEDFFAKAEFFVQDGDAKLLKFLLDTVVRQQRWK